MDSLNAIILFILGVVLISARQQLSLLAYRQMPAFLRSKIGKPDDTDNWYITYNRSGALFIGILLVIASFIIMQK